MSNETRLSGIGTIMWAPGESVPSQTDEELCMEVRLHTGSQTISEYLNLKDKVFECPRYDPEDIEYRKIEIQLNGTIWPFGIGMEDLEDIDLADERNNFRDLLAFSSLPAKLVWALTELLDNEKMFSLTIYAPIQNRAKPIPVTLEICEHNVGIDIENTNNYFSSWIRKINAEMDNFDPEEYEDSGVIIEDGEFEDLGDEDAETSPDEDEALLEGMSVKRSKFNIH